MTTEGQTLTPGQTRSGIWVWLGQAVSGVLLLGLLGMHMIAHHYVVEGGLRNYAQVLAYVGNPLIVVTELTFLVVVTYHALLGVRSIMLDLGLNAGQQRVLNVALLVVGLATVAYGFYLALTLFWQATG